VKQKDDQNLPAPRPSTIGELGALAAKTARDNLLESLHDNGLTEVVLADVARDLIGATKQRVQWDKVSGEFKYSRPLVDNAIRLGTLRMLLEIHDVFPSKKIDVNDKRQTKELVSELLGRMEEKGLLGIEDKDGGMMGDVIDLVPDPPPDSDDDTDEWEDVE
jgi:hypothetical protein